MKNWKWLLPLAVISAFFPITICVLTAVLITCFLVIKSSRVYRKTVATVEGNPEVISHLGSPVKPGLLVMGNISRMSTGTMVNLSVPISGPRGRATAFAVLRKEEERWRFTTLQVECREGGAHIDLLHT